MWLRYLGSEIAELAIRRWRYLAYLLVACASVIVAGNLVVRTLPVKVVLFEAGLADHLEDYKSASLREAILIMSDVTLLEDPGYYDPTVVRALDADLAIGVRDGQVAVTVNDHASGNATAPLLSISLAKTVEGYFKGTWRDPLEELITTPPSDNVAVKRMTLLPQTQRWMFIPRVIALLSIFASFLVAFESYSRHASSRHLQVQLAGAGGGFGQMMLAKLLIASTGGVCTLAVLLIVISSLFGISPRAPLAEVLLVYLLGCFVSAAFGLAAATMIGPARQLFATIAAYFFSLIVFSGFIAPLAAADRLVQWGSLALPLRYPLAVLDGWLSNGQPPPVFASMAELLKWPVQGLPPSQGGMELLSFLLLCLIAGLLLVVASISARQRV